MSVWLIVGTALAGGLGSALRFLLDTAVRGRFGSRFPWGPPVLNLTGFLPPRIITGLGSAVLPARTRVV